MGPNSKQGDNITNLSSARACFFLCLGSVRLAPGETGTPVAPVSLRLQVAARQAEDLGTDGFHLCSLAGMLSK